MEFLPEATTAHVLVIACKNYGRSCGLHKIHLDVPEVAWNFSNRFVRSGKMEGVLFSQNAVFQHLAQIQSIYCRVSRQKSLSHLLNRPTFYMSWTSALQCLQQFSEAPNTTLFNNVRLHKNKILMRAPRYKRQCEFISPCMWSTSFLQQASASKQEYLPTAT